jgi:hypothetical protein
MGAIAFYLLKRGKHVAAAAIVGCAAALCVAFAATSAITSKKDGGGAISTAPTLAIGTTVTGGADLSDNCCDSWYQHENTAGTQYWRVPLTFGDHLIIDYGVVTGDNVTLCMLSPDVTDYTLPDADCVAGDQTETKHEFTFTASKTGAWILVVGDYHCCSDTTWGYQLTAYVHRPLLVKLTQTTTRVISQAKHTPLPHTGKLAVLVSTLDGRPVPAHSVGGTLQGYWLKAWHKLSTAQALSGQIILPYRIPSTLHGLIRFSINVGGGNYIGKGILLRDIKV